MHVLIIVSLTLLTCILGCKSLYSSQPIIAPSFCHPCPVVEAHCRAGRACVELWAYIGAWAVVGGYRQSAGLLLMRYWIKCQQWLPLHPPGAVSGPGCICIPQRVFSAAVATPGPVPHCDMEWVELESSRGLGWGKNTEVVTGNLAGAIAVFSRTCQDGCLSVYSPFSSVPSQKHRSRTIAFLSSLPDYVYIFPTALVVWGRVGGSCCQFPVSFQWELFTCRCIFDVFVVRGELHILLLDPPDWSPIMSVL